MNNNNAMNEIVKEFRKWNEIVDIVKTVLIAIYRLYNLI